MGNWGNERKVTVEVEKENDIERAIGDFFDDDNRRLEPVSFDVLGLKPDVLTGLFGLVKLLPVQQRAIGPCISSKDVIVQAPSATGKTSTAVIAAIQLVDPDQHCCQVLFLVPAKHSTKVQDEVDRLGHKKIDSFASMEGETFSKERIKTIRNAQIVIGTPCAAYDMLKRCLLPTAGIKMVILDNASDLMSVRYKEKVYGIFKRLYFHRQLIMLTTVMTPDIVSFVESNTIDPVRIIIKDPGRLVGVENYLVKVDSVAKKKEVLLSLQTTMYLTQAIIFCNSHDKVDEVADYLLKNTQLTVSAPHRGKQKESSVQDFTSGNSLVMVTLDMSSHEFQVDKTFLVINYDVPSRPDKYLSRVGCGGRLSRRGVVINLVTDKDVQTLQHYLEFYGVEGKPLTIPESRRSSHTKPDMATVSTCKTSSPEVPPAVVEDKDYASYESMGLKQKLLEGIKASGLKKPRPIEQQSIPSIIEGRQVIIQSSCSATTIGACCIGALFHLDPKERQCQILVLVPFRGMAYQVERQVYSLGAYMNVTCRTCIGGTDIKTDKAAFEKGAQIVVGTPTRLEDVMTRKFLKVNQIKLLVVLKADEQFQDEFHKTFLKIVSKLNSNIQMILVAETLPPIVWNVASQRMPNVHVISNTPNEVSLKGVHQYYVASSSGRKARMVLYIYPVLATTQTVIVCKSQTKVDVLLSLLKKQGCSAAALSPKLGKAEREGIINRFNAGPGLLLLTTDLKGYEDEVKIKRVQLLFMYFLPTKLENYPHNKVHPGQLDTKSSIVYLVIENQLERLQKEFSQFYKTAIEDLSPDKEFN